MIFKRLGPHLASLGRNHEMMSAVVLDEGFARKVMIASHDSGGELIASQSNVCCWQLFGSPHVIHILSQTFINPILIDKLKIYRSGVCGYNW